MTRTAWIAFDRQCEFAGLPVPIAEFHFHPKRRWRFDWAFPDHSLALEVQGGAFLGTGGRHTRGGGFRRDAEKFTEAAILGWRVLHVLPEQMADGQALRWVERALAWPAPTAAAPETALAALVDAEHRMRRALTQVQDRLHQAKDAERR